MRSADLDGLLDEPLPHLEHPDPAVRRLALAACTGRVREPDIKTAVARCLDADPDASVRAAAAEVLAEAGEEALQPLLAARTDPDARVVEAVATGLGEVADPLALPFLIDSARHHADRLVREAATAALGAVGDASAVPVLLELLAGGPPQVRRRAAVALTVFEDPRIEPALQEARRDRNPMVREVVEMIIGREPPVWPHPLREEPSGPPGSD